MFNEGSHLLICVTHLYVAFALMLELLFLSLMPHCYKRHVCMMDKVLNEKIYLMYENTYCGNRVNNVFEINC